MNLVMTPLELLEAADETTTPDEKKAWLAKYRLLDRTQIADAMIRAQLEQQAQLFDRSIGGSG